jgi:DNA-binding transcriptional LysR family regulator
MRFDLTDLRLFLRVAEAGSITHGAAQANLALASASERLRSMENMIGLPLLVRHPRGIELSLAGRALAHHARLILRQVDQMQGELGDYARGFKTQIRLWANTSAMTGYLPERLAPFLAAQPDVEVDLKERPSSVIVQAVAEEFADIGIVSSAIDTGSLELVPFANDRIMLVVPVNHRLAKQRRMAFLEALGEPWVGLTQGNPLQEFLREQASLAGQAMQIRVRIPSFEAMGQMVHSGVGIGFMTESAARKFKRTMNIHAIHLSDPWASRRLSLCMRSRSALPARARELVERLTQEGAVSEAAEAKGGPAARR